MQIKNREEKKNVYGSSLIHKILFFPLSASQSSGKKKKRTKDDVYSHSSNNSIFDTHAHTVPRSSIFFFSII